MPSSFKGRGISKEYLKQNVITSNNFDGAFLNRGLFCSNCNNKLHCFVALSSNRRENEDNKKCLVKARCTECLIRTPVNDCLVRALSNDCLVNPPRGNNHVNAPFNDCDFDVCRTCTLGTQAKAAVSKSLQADCAKKVDVATQSIQTGNSLKWSSSVSSVSSRPSRRTSEILCKQCNEVNVYYQDKGKCIANKGCCAARKSLEKEKPKSSSSIEKKCSRSTQKSRNEQTKPPKEKASTDDEESVQTRLISHIQITPRISCPIYGALPCQGPQCQLNLKEQEEKSPVTVTRKFNSRRGVFEVVIRKQNGKGVKNELMLEWTPPSPKGGLK